MSEFTTLYFSVLLVKNLFVTSKFEKIWTKPVLASPCYFSCRCRFSDPLSKQGSWIREYFSKKLSHRLPVYHRPPAINENFCGSTSSQAFVYHDVLDLGHFNVEWCLFLIYIFLIKWSTMLSTCLLHIFLSPLVMLSTKVNFSSAMCLLNFNFKGSEIIALYQMYLCKCVF